MCIYVYIYTKIGGSTFLILPGVWDSASKAAMWRMHRVGVASKRGHTLPKITWKLMDGPVLIEDSRLVRGPSPLPCQFEAHPVSPPNLSCLVLIQTSLSHGATATSSPPLPLVLQNLVAGLSCKPWSQAAM